MLKKIIFAIVLILVVVQGQRTDAGAYECTNGTNVQTTAYDHETLTVSNTAKVLTASKYNGSDGGGNAIQADLSTEGSIRVWFDGSAPTAAVGIPLVGSASAPVYFLVCSASLSKLQMIRQSADATVSVQYQR